MDMSQRLQAQDITASHGLLLRHPDTPNSM